MKISVIIVEYFSIDEIRTCVTSFREQFPDMEIIVSSNSLYSRKQQQLIQQEFNDCLWSFNEKNGGFAYGMNRGLELASGDYFIISNPDCIVKSGLLKMVQFLNNHKEVGAIAPKLIDDNGVLQDSCRRYVTIPRFIYRQIRRLLMHEDVVLDKSINYDIIQTVDWVIGAFIMIPKIVYERTKGLCEDYFMYAEDIDWCTRIRRLGYEIVYYPKAEVLYKGSRNARKSLKYARIFLKSHFCYWKKFGYIFIRPQRKYRTFNEY